MVLGITLSWKWIVKSDITSHRKLFLHTKIMLLHIVYCMSCGYTFETVRILTFTFGSIYLNEMLNCHKCCWLNLTCAEYAFNLKLSLLELSWNIFNTHVKGPYGIIVFSQNKLLMLKYCYVPSTVKQAQYQVPVHTVVFCCLSMMKHYDVRVAVDKSKLCVWVSTWQGN